MNAQNWPAWYFGPEGKSGIFQNQAEVPAGWEDHPSKVEGGAVESDDGTRQAVDGVYPNPGGLPQGQGEHFNPGGFPLGTSTEVGTTTLQGAQLPDSNPHEVDADGWPWTAEIHSPSHEKTNAGLWKLKPGQTRPAAKPGFPLDL